MAGAVACGVGVTLFRAGQPWEPASQVEGPPGAVGCGLPLWVSPGEPESPSGQPASACGPSLLCLMPALGLIYGHLLPMDKEASQVEGGW